MQKKTIKPFQQINIKKCDCISFLLIMHVDTSNFKNLHDSKYDEIFKGLFVKLLTLVLSQDILK